MWTGSPLFFSKKSLLGGKKAPAGMWTGNPILVVRFLAVFSFFSFRMGVRATFYGIFREIFRFFRTCSEYTWDHFGADCGPQKIRNFDRNFDRLTHGNTYGYTHGYTHGYTWVRGSP